jgi:hypothetical protein
LKHLFFFFFPLSGFSKFAEPSSIAPVSVPRALAVEAEAIASSGSNSDSFLFSVWSVEDEEGSITVGEPVSTDIGPDLFVNVGLEDGTDDVIAFAISSPIDNDVICGGLEEDPFPEGAMEVGTRDAGILVGGCCFFLIQSL